MTGRALAFAFAAALVIVGGAAAALTWLLPGNIAVEAESAAGTIVNYEASARNPQGREVGVTCTPPSGSLFPLGDTTVTCTDGSGLESQSFTVSVRDGGPVVGQFADRTVEANGPSGSRINYESPRGTDAIEGPVPVTCAPASGAMFPVGPTIVVCTATDSQGNLGTSSATFTVSDRTPPTLAAPSPITVTATVAEGVPATAPAIAAFLGGARASDLVTAQPAVVNNAPQIFSVGPTPVLFTATDDAGNSATATATVTVLPPPASGQPPPGPGPPSPGQPAARDLSPPRNVTRLRAVAGNRSITLAWVLPTDADLVRVVVERSEAAGGPAREVYRGKGTRFVDAGLRNGTDYRYLVVSYDTAGNRSTGVPVNAMPRDIRLIAPRDGSVVRRPPVLLWKPAPRATFYNVQLYRGSTKILTAWPAKNRFVLRRSWTFGGRRQLTPGLYRWYVWPAFGRRTYPAYGSMLGTSTFAVAARP
jgi:hypothetical protein